MSALLKPGQCPISTSTKSESDAPNGWRWVLLSEVARLESGHTPSRREPLYWNGGEVPWLSLKDIKGLSNAYVNETADMPTQLGIDNSSARVLPKDTVAFCRTASVGNVAILGCNMATSQDFVNWVCSERLSSKYLYWALKASKDEFNKEKQGATHKTIYMPTVKRFQVLLPPLAEQRRIAGILDAADAIRRKRQQAIALTEQFLRSTFLDMFGDPVTNPKGWPIVLMKDLFAISPNYGTMVVPNDESGEYLDLRVANIQNGILDLTSRKYVDLEANVVQRHQVLDGDILLARAIGSKEHLGKCFVAHPGTEKWAFDSHLMRIRLNLEVVHPQFLQSYLASPGGRYEFLKHTRRSAVQFNVNTKEIAKVRVPLPPIEKQSEYIAIRKANARTKRHHEVLVQELNNLFNSLVQRAFRGEL